MLTSSVGAQGALSAHGHDLGTGLRVHQDFVAGHAFYWAPGHAPEALESSEYVDFSPTEKFQHVIDYASGHAQPIELALQHASAVGT